MGATIAVRQQALDDLVCVVRSPAGRRLELSGPVVGGEPAAVTGSVRLGGNRALVESAWAYARHALALLAAEDSRSKSGEQEAADRLGAAARELAEMLDRTTAETVRAWCSACFGRFRHRRVKSGKGAAIYLCSGCGLPTRPCAAPSCTNMAIRGLGKARATRFCAEHRHEIPSFSRASLGLGDPTQFQALIVFEKKNLVKAARRGVIVAGLAPAAAVIQPMVAVGVLAAGWQWRGGVRGAGRKVPVRPGPRRASAEILRAARLRSGLGARLLYDCFRDDPTLNVVQVAEGSGVPVVVAPGFAFHRTSSVRQIAETMTRNFPDSPVYVLAWGVHELAALWAAGRPGGGEWEAAIARADRAATGLAVILAAWRVDEMVLVGSGLGGRVVAGATWALGVDGGAQSSSGEPRIGAVHLLGPALPRDEDWAGLGAAASEVHNYHCARDRFLRDHDTVDGRDTVGAGLVGLVNPPANVVDHEVDWYAIGPDFDDVVLA